MDEGPKTTCSQCGYELMGLEKQGCCPECGQYYDMLSGKGPGSQVSQRQDRGHRLIARLRTGCIGAATILVLVCGGLAATFSTNPRRPITIALIVGTVGILATITSYVYEKDEG